MTRSVDRARWLKAFVPSLVALAVSACGGDSDPPPPPAAVALANSDALSVKWDAETALSVTANDTVANGTATLAVSTAPAHGTATVSGQTIRYTPAAGYFGTDTLRYLLTVGDKSSEAEVQIAVAAELTVTGTVRDNPMPGASVVATVAGTALPAVTADANGDYSLVITTTDPSAFISLKATGAGEQSSVVLASLVGDAAEAAAASTAGAVNATTLPAANVTHISTAIAVLSEQALGKPPASSADIKAAQGQFTASQTVEMATAIKLVADKGVALPSGSADTLALVSQPTAYAGFVVAQSTANPTTFADTRQEVLGDPAIAVTPPTPVAGGADTTILLVQGEGASANSAIRLVLQANGTARIESDAVRAAKWTSNGAEIAVTYDAPAISQGYSSTLDPVTQSQNLVENRETGFVLRQLGGSTGSGPATVKSLASFTYLDGSRAGQTGSSDGSWDAQTMVGATTAFVADEFAAGARWAGVISSDFSPITSSYVDQDILVVVDATKVTFERSQQAGTYRLVDGKLELTMGDAVFTYSRLFVGPRGEERWLAEKRVNSVLAWVYEPAAVKVQSNTGFSAAALANRWASYINVGVSSGQFLIELFSDGTGRGVSVDATGEEYPQELGLWSVSTAGEMSLKRGCNPTYAGCTPWHQRDWRLLGSSGDRIYVLERLKIQPSYDQYRVNVYTVQPKP
ncbi:MAG TPA: Ig-like domain-containing protein [Ideonella sp.]|nr:Ig-like domain-containing protein [Ideonella sp.]